MKRATVIVAISVTSVISVASRAQVLPQFRATATGVGVHVVVRSGGMPVRDLTPSDFSLTDTGVRQEVVAVDATTVSLDISVVLQESVRTEWYAIETFEKELAAVAGFTGSSDRLRVVLAGDDQRELMVPLNRDLGAEAALKKTCVPVYDALARTLMEPTDPARQHVIVLLSVGEGRGSVLSNDPVADIARRSNARLYVVSIEPLFGRTTYRSYVSWTACPSLEIDWSVSRQARLRQLDRMELVDMQRRELWLDSKNRLVDIAKLTGGGEIRPTLLRQSNTGPILRALEEVRAGYVLRYTAKGVPDTGWHPITVTINRPGKYDVQVRPGYQR